MKYVILLGDGMADEPLQELGGRTPLEYAHTPNMDRIAREGVCGLIRTVPAGLDPGSDVANLSILGYDPLRHYTGRGPLEAASMGLPLKEGDVAYRCNLVTVEDGVMIDFSAGHISGGEGKELLGALAGLLNERFSLHPGVSYRNILVLHPGEGAETTPPHDIMGMPIAPYLPRGSDAPLLRWAMERSAEAFSGHPVNLARRGAGKRPATMIWPWGGGRTPELPSFREKYGIRGGMISAVDLLKGIAVLAGLEVIRVPGATGYLDTDYRAKAEYARKALERLDLVFVHVEAPDEASHMGSIEEKVRAIERVDGMLEIICRRFGGVVAILTDHPTPIRLRTHTTGPVPFAVRGIGRNGCTGFSEREAARGALGELSALELLPTILERARQTRSTLR